MTTRMTTTTSASAPAYSSSPLSILSWNISNAQPSHSAPNKQQRAEESPRLIRLACLEARARSRPAVTRNTGTGNQHEHAHRPPDIIALQECPYPTWGDEEFGSSGYVSMGAQPSHCGYVDLLLRSELARTSRPLFRQLRAQNLPSVATTILLPNRTRIAVSSSHLAPFKDGAGMRAMQCRGLMRILSEECDDCILVGDFNMRTAEDKMVENCCGGGWTDAWKGCGSGASVKFTWDSFVNKYHDGGFGFKARFDRCYIRGEALGLNHFSFVGNQPVKTEDGGGGRGDFLSDHFGLLVGLDVGAAPVREEDVVDLTEDD